MAAVIIAVSRLCGRKRQLQSTRAAVLGRTEGGTDAFSFVARGLDRVNEAISVSTAIKPHILLFAPPLQDLPPANLPLISSSVSPLSVSSATKLLVPRLVSAPYPTRVPESYTQPTQRTFSVHTTTNLYANYNLRQTTFVNSINTRRACDINVQSNPSFVFDLCLNPTAQTIA